jgi:hypothetical protein
VIVNCSSPAAVTMCPSSVRQSRHDQIAHPNHIGAGGDGATGGRRRACP